MCLQPNTKQAEEDLRNCNLPSFHLVVLWVSFVSIKFSLSSSLHLNGGLGILSLHSSSSDLESHPLSKSKANPRSWLQVQNSIRKPRAHCLCPQLYPQCQENPQLGRGETELPFMPQELLTLGSSPLLFPSFLTWTIMILPKPFAQVSRSQVLVSNVP